MRHLALSIAPDDVRFDFMASMLLPGLQLLGITVPIWSPADPEPTANRAECLRSLLHRSKTPLIRLSLEGLKLSAGSAFVSLFQNLDNLRILVMDGDQMGDDLLETLSSTAEGKNIHLLLPLLQSIHLIGFSPDAPDAFRKFLLSRCWEPPRMLGELGIPNL